MTDNQDILSSRKELGAAASRRQRLAASPDKSIWVGASAGTGKTKVLSDRVLRLLLAGVNAGKILCLTYTKAAAVEMSSRIAERLGKWAVADDAELEKELEKLYGSLPADDKSLNLLKAKARRLFATLLETPGGIKIQTFHSFCEEILKRFPLEADISPYFDIMDARTSLEAITDVKNKLIAEAGNFPESPFGKAMAFITDNISEYAFPEVINAIISERGRIEQAIKQYGGTDKLLSAVSRKLNIPDTLSEERIIEEFAAKAPVDDLRRLAAAGMENIAPWTDGTNDIRNYTEYMLLFLTGKNEPRSISRNKILNKNPELAEIFLSEGERCLELTDKLKSFKVYQSTKSVLLLASELIKRYNVFKRSHAKMDFNDIILLTRNLLENKDAAKWVLFKLDGGIDNILIDEAQDTSPDQWAIIRSICDEFFAGLGSSENTRTIFAVGDRKQSIYSFQGADPDKFDEMRDHFASLAPNFEKVNLEISFRSAPAILAAVNRLFADENTRRGVASEGENIEHIPFRKGESGEVEFWEMIEPEEEPKNDEWMPPVQRIQKISTSSQMAKAVARKIKQTVASGEMLQSKQRPLQYGDFLVLVRSRDEFCQEFIRECKNLNINVAGIDRIHLMDQIAVQDLVSLGQFLLLPDDDLSLAEVLKSPLFGLDDDDLFILCRDRSGSLWSSLLANSGYAETSGALKQLFNKVDFMRPFELYNYILSEMGGRKKFYGRMGPEAEDGLDEFINLSLAFEQEHIPTLQNFIEWITSDDVEIKRETEQGKNNLVRLMTVHGSKGLQAPVVILPDTTKIPQTSRESCLLWDKDLFFYPTSASDYNNLCDRLHENKKNKALEEYRRLMYVAVTRAEDRMIFCGYRKKDKSPENSWYNLFKNSFTKIAALDEKQNIWTLTSRQEILPDKKETAVKNKKQAPVPDFMLKPAAEEQPLSKPLTPSRPDDEPAVVSPLAVKDNGVFYKRGSLIHKLLQFLPETAPQNRKDEIVRFIKQRAPEFDLSETNKICAEILSLLDNPSFGSVFGPCSKAEVPLMGEIGGKIISGQIDRLVIGQNQIIIVDFKTNRRPAAAPDEVPAAYVSQLGAYKALLQKIYPEKEIKTYILWTNSANMMEI